MRRTSSVACAFAGPAASAVGTDQVRESARVRALATATPTKTV
jgi:hypothetical protein